MPKRPTTIARNARSRWTETRGHDAEMAGHDGPKYADKPRANTAVAHKLARMIYFMLTRGEAYVDQGQQNYEEQQRQRSIAALRRRAAELGFAVTPTAATA